MGLFNSPEKEMKRQFKEQMARQDESNESQVAMQMTDRGQIAFEPQVSQLILEGNRMFLPWTKDYEHNEYVLPDKYRGLLEPYSVDDARSFLTDEEKMLLMEIDENMQDNFKYGEEHGFDDKLIRAFNRIVYSRWNLLGNSRTTGKPSKLAKSQYVESSSFIKRGVDGKEGKQNKLFGLF